MYLSTGSFMVVRIVILGHFRYMWCRPVSSFFIFSWFFLA